MAVVFLENPDSKLFLVKSLVWIFFVVNLIFLYRIVLEKIKELFFYYWGKRKNNEWAKVESVVGKDFYSKEYNYMSEEQASNNTGMIYSDTYSEGTLQNFLVKHKDNTPVVKKFLEGFVARFNTNQDLKTLQTVLKGLNLRTDMEESYNKFLETLVKRKEIQKRDLEIDHEIDRLKRKNEVENIKLDVEEARLNKETAEYEREKRIAEAFRSRETNSKPKTRKQIIEKAKNDILSSLSIDETQYAAIGRKAEFKIKILKQVENKARKDFPGDDSIVREIILDVNRQLNQDE